MNSCWAIVVLTKLTHAKLISHLVVIIAKINSPVADLYLKSNYFSKFSTSFGSPSVVSNFFMNALSGLSGNGSFLGGKLFIQ